jgi:hypothetical protein
MEVLTAILRPLLPRPRRTPLLHQILHVESFPSGDLSHYFFLLFILRLYHSHDIPFFRTEIDDYGVGTLR